jgi:hypothetical protein
MEHESPWSRETAIEWLRSKGLYAKSRDWSFGESVIVASESESVSVGAASTRGVGQEITVLHNMLCIHPENDGWSVSDLSSMKVVSMQFGSLESAARNAAEKLLAGGRNNSQG